MLLYMEIRSLYMCICINIYCAIYVCKHGNVLP